MKDRSLAGDGGFVEPGARGGKEGREAFIPLRSDGAGTQVPGGNPRVARTTERRQVAAGEQVPGGNPAPSPSPRLTWLFFVCVVAQLGLIAVIARDRDVAVQRREHAEAQVANVVRLCVVDQLTGAATCPPKTFQHRPIWSAP